VSQTLVMTLDTLDSISAYQTGILLVNSLHHVLSGPRHGRYYPVPGNPAYDRATPKKLRADNYYIKFIGTTNRSEIRGAAYRASAPGEPPAPRTGRLRQSFNMTVTQIRQDQYRVSIRTNVFYADDLEYGSESVAPRPFMEKAFNRVASKLIGVIRKSQVRILRNVV
jgi:hypothetical protein